MHGQMAQAALDCTCLDKKINWRLFQTVCKAVTANYIQNTSNQNKGVIAKMKSGTWKINKSAPHF